MRRLFPRTQLALVSALVVAAATARSAPYIIYGNDDRIEAYQIQDPRIAEAARSTAALIPPTYAEEKMIESEGPDGIALADHRLTRDGGWKRGTRFGDQTDVAKCTAFLVGEDLIATAGHCASKSDDDWKDYRIVFDYALARKGDDPTRLPAKNVFRAVELIASVHDVTRFPFKWPEGASDYAEYGNDYALLRLDRKVEGRKILRFDSQPGKIRVGTKLALIGYPLGLPLKVDPNVVVREVFAEQKYAWVYSDSFSGNSGSPVYDPRTDRVVGVFVAGAKDSGSSKKRNNSDGPLVTRTATPNEGQKESMTLPFDLIEILGRILD